MTFRQLRTANFWPLLMWLVVVFVIYVMWTDLWPSDGVMCELTGGIWMEGSWCKRW